MKLRENATDFYALSERFLSRILAQIYEVTGLSEQHRGRASDALVQELKEATDCAEIVDAMRQHDVLDGRLWWQLGRCKWESEPEQALAAFVVAADIERIDPKIWALVACAAVALRAPETLVDDICDAGLKWCGSDFLDAVEKLCEDGEYEEFNSIVRTKIYERANHEHPRWKRVVRIVNSDGKYETFELAH